MDTQTSIHNLFRSISFVIVLDIEGTYYKNNAPLPEIKDKLDSVLLVFHLIKRFLRLSLISINSRFFIFGFKLRVSNYTLFIINETRRWLKILKYSHCFVGLVINSPSQHEHLHRCCNFKNIYFLIQNESSKCDITYLIFYNNSFISFDHNYL